MRRSAVAFASIQLTVLRLTRTAAWIMLCRNKLIVPFHVKHILLH
jgi:hypothetical protein